jgi:cytochrome c peroxidase
VTRLRNVSRGGDISSYFNILVILKYLHILFYHIFGIGHPKPNYVTRLRNVSRGWAGLFALLIFLISACQKESRFQSVQLPAHFPDPVYDLSANPVTEAGMALGKKLFYDPTLSRDGNISCGSCHQQAAAFAHQSHDFSHGVDDRLGTRNAPTLQNLAWRTTFGWDGGVPHLDLFPMSPIENPVEMDEKLSNVLQKLRRHPEYPALFEAAFGTQEITTNRLMLALSQFQLMLVSADSRYDAYAKGNTSVFSADESAGLTLFRQHCADCHAEPLFTNNTFKNNGLAALTLDLGRYAISLDSADIRHFKVPSLRNVDKSAPYFHDGRTRRLEDAVEHYRSGIRTAPTLDPRLSPGGLPFSAQEKMQLVAFLKTLTDEGFLKDPRFGGE